MYYFLLGISEYRWKDVGKNIINSDEIIIYLGRRDGRYYEEVVIILSKVVVKFLIKYYFVSERMIRVRFKIKFIEIKYISLFFYK